MQTVNPHAYIWQNHIYVYNSYICVRTTIAGHLLSIIYLMIAYIMMQQETKQKSTSITENIKESLSTEEKEENLLKEDILKNLLTPSTLEEKILYLTLLDEAIINSSDLTEEEKSLIGNNLLTTKWQLKNSLSIQKWYMPDLRLLNTVSDSIDDLIHDLNTWWAFEINNPEFIKQIATLYGKKEHILQNEVNKVKEVWKINSFFTIYNLDTQWINKHSTLILIWINEYSWGNDDLNWAINDIENAKETISKIYWIPKKNIIILVNEDANKENILKTLEKQCDDKQKTIVYYAWHWVLSDVDEKTYIMPSDGNSNIPTTLISPEDFNNAINWNNVLLIADMCHASWFINNLDNNISWVWSTKSWVTKEIINTDWARQWNFSLQFLNLLKDTNWDIEESLSILANTVNN